ncbi:MAG: rod shape-determining protein MreD [Pseudomonadota bacterium]
MTFTLVLALIVQAAPTRIPNGPDLMPLLPLMVLYIWAVRRPGFTAPWVIFLVGLATDFLTGGLLGVWALSFLVGFAFARPPVEEPATPGGELLPISLRFAALAGIVLVTAWAVGSLALGSWVSPAPLIADGVLSILLFPLLAFFFARRKERSTFS